MTKEENGESERKELEKIMNEAMRLKRKGNYKEAIVAFNRLKKILIRLGLSNDLERRKFTEAEHQIATTLLNMALEEAREKGEEPDMSGAISAFLTAVGEREMTKDVIGGAYSYFGLAMCKELGGYSREEVSFEYGIAMGKAWNAIEEINKSDGGVADLADMKHNIAYVWQYARDFPRAIGQYEEVLELRRKSSDERALNLTKARLAQCYKETGNLEKAISYAREALKFFEKTQDIDRIRQVKETIESIKKAEKVI